MNEAWRVICAICCFLKLNWNRSIYIPFLRLYSACFNLKYQTERGKFLFGNLPLFRRTLKSTSRIDLGNSSVSLRHTFHHKLSLRRVVINTVCELSDSRYVAKRVLNEFDSKAFLDVSSLFDQNLKIDFGQTLPSYHGETRTPFRLSEQG